MFLIHHQIYLLKFMIGESYSVLACYSWVVRPCKISQQKVMIIWDLFIWNLSKHLYRHFISCGIINSFWFRAEVYRATTHIHKAICISKHPNMSKTCIRFQSWCSLIYANKSEITRQKFAFFSTNSCNKLPMSSICSRVTPQTLGHSNGCPSASDGYD